MAKKNADRSDPPRHTRFVNGKSGNPKGRPKGSKNVSSYLMDAARDPEIVRLLTALSLPAQPLGDLLAVSGQAAHAPCLIELGQAGSSAERNESSAFVEAFLNAGWGNNWGIFFASSSPLQDVFRHFSDFFPTTPDDRRKVNLRFYDPRVLRAFLPTCEPQEIDTIFGPVASYLVEAERSDTLLMLSRNASGLVTVNVRLSDQSLERQEARAGMGSS